MLLTIMYEGEYYEVDFDYQPYEAPDRGPEAQYPGCGEGVEGINAMMSEGKDFADEFNDDFDKIAEIILEKLADERIPDH